MRLKVLSLVVTTVVIISFALVCKAEAQWGRGRCGMGMGMGQGFFPDYFQGLNLTQDQTAKINNLHSEFFKVVASLRSDIYAKKLELNNLLFEQVPDPEKAKKIQDELFDLKKKLAQKRLQCQIEARKILTPEQIAQLPPGCSLGFGNMYGWGNRGFGGGYGPGFGCNMWLW
jgi:Spy/CpxP family protein refolding chaperone